MPAYVEIAVNVPQVSGVFHYHLPPELEGRLAPGCLVEVPFGRQQVQGVVLRSVDEPSVPETRPVTALLDPQPALTPLQIALAHHLAESTLAPLAACLDLMLPPGLSQQVDSLYSLVAPPPGERKRAGLPTLQQRLLALLEKRGPLRGRQIDASLPKLDWRKAAAELKKQGLLTWQPVLPPPTVRPKFVRTARLAASPEKALEAMPTLARAGTPALARRQAMLQALLREPGEIEVPWLYAESGGTFADLERLAELGLVILGESEVWRDPLENLDLEIAHPLGGPAGSPLPPLLPDQAAAWEALLPALQGGPYGGPPFLLHGVTGSGKTELYLRAAAEVLRQGRGAILLVPEIALTPQAVRRFLARFPGQVGLVHSGLSPGERYDTWRRVRQGQLPLVVGPRSALFAPLPQVGLIVVDECHDDSYYQSEGAPYYHAREAAVAYARLAGAVCVLGTATPDMTSAYRAARGEYRYLRLPRRILAHGERVQRELPEGAPAAPAPAGGLPPVRVVDMRLELQAGNRSLFSRPLQEALARVLERGQQAILFLNRRGQATYVFCRDCGQALRCPRCDLPLTYHLERAPSPTPPGQAGLPDFPEAQAASALTCHHCGYRRGLPSRCPNCGSGRIRHFGAGTQRVEEELHALFPNARTLRWDAETARQKGAHEIILAHFANRRADVLIGTQMLAKGLDLPHVTLVGAMLADVGLHLPDYRAGERVFAVLTQVAGRAGRSPLGGEAIFQTFDPENYVIRAAAGHDFRAFYEQELAYRRRLRYPPFTRLVRLEFRHRDPDLAEEAAHELAAQLRSWLERGERRATDLIGPAPPFFDRLGGLYRWQIVLRGPDPASILKDRPLAGWRIEVDPVSLL